MEANAARFAADDPSDTKRCAAPTVRGECGIITSRSCTHDSLDVKTWGYQINFLRPELLTVTDHSGRIQLPFQDGLVPWVHDKCMLSLGSSCPIADGSAWLIFHERNTYPSLDAANAAKFLIPSLLPFGNEAMTV